MKKIIDINNWDRTELYKHYDLCTNPFIILTTTIDITNLYNYVKENKLSMYASLGFYLLNAINEFDGFKYRKEDNELVLFDIVNANFTDSTGNNDLFFYSVNYNDNLLDFNKEYRNNREEYLHNNKKYKNKKPNENEVWFSCAPWFNINSLIPPFNHDNYIPQFIWDKFKIENNKVTTNLMIMVHHGFIDGYHLGKFFDLLQKNLNSAI
jgi:chloramphenicol O-acetyltransferase type A